MASSMDEECVSDRHFGSLVVNGVASPRSDYMKASPAETNDKKGSAIDASLSRSRLESFLFATSALSLALVVSRLCILASECCAL